MGCLFKRFTEEYDDDLWFCVVTIDRSSSFGINVTIQIRQITTKSNIYTVLPCLKHLNVIGLVCCSGNPERNKRLKNVMRKLTMT